MLSQRSKKRKRDSSPPDFPQLMTDIERALMRFESTSNHAVLRLYQRRLGSTAASTASVESFTEADVNSMLTDTENEHVFLVYL